MQGTKIFKYSILILTVSATLFYGCQSNVDPEPVSDPLAYVDPMIGTGGHGHTFPGATVPFGMVQLSPSNDYKGWDWSSGYHITDSIIKGFAHNHISGPGLAGLGDILLMPGREAHTGPGTEMNPDTGYRARFSHDAESASAGYYSVHFSDEDIRAELTAGRRMGYHKYTFGGDGPAYIMIDPTHSINENILEAGIEQLSPTEIQGYKYCEGWSAGERTMYFYAQFSKPISSFRLSSAGEPMAGTAGAQKDLMAQLGFDLNPGDSVLVRLALSSVSTEGAKANFAAEAAETFAEAHQQARNSWSEKLSTIDLYGATDKQKRIFYTGMYHAFISPNLISDVDGQYYVEGEVYQSDIPQYSNFSTWDTYRALHPLFTIIEQEKTAEFVNSLSSRVTEAKVGLPSWECLGYDNRCMIGYSAVSPISDAVLKNVPGINEEAAYQAIRYAAFDPTKHSSVSDVSGMDEYLKYGYVTAETGASVSKTTEQNYSDWTIARVAEKLGKTEDVKLFDRRAIGYRNLFDPAYDYLLPRTSQGDLLQLDTSKWNSMKGHYISGNIWAYSAYTPHDMKGIIQLHGGREAYTEWLNQVFTNESPVEGHQHVDISGFIGKYGHGDEPGHHMPYLFNYIGQPWRTQEYVREVMTTMYQDNPEEGFINNEDLGQMSAWYLLSSLGMYQVAPGDGVFQLGAPLHPRADMHLENGKTFTILGTNVSEVNKYVQSVSLNGSAYAKNYLPYEAIMAGGTLEFVMGPRPNKEWGSSPEATSLGDFDDTAAPLIPVVGTPAPYDVQEQALFSGQKEVELTSASPDATIYYTLDGRDPDRSAMRYDGPFTISDDVVLKAIAYEEGMNPSAIYEKHYFESVFALLPEGYPKYSVQQDEFPYGEDGGHLIFDQAIGSDNYSDNKWTGIKEDLNISIDLGVSQLVRSATVGYLVETNSWIFPPRAIVIRGGSSEDDLREIGRIDLAGQTKHEQKVYRREVPVQPGNYQYITVDLINYGAAPAWHGSGQEGELWVFVDEVYLN
jgi:predicted alpha-1,2-mannosidase